MKLPFMLALRYLNGRRLRSFLTTLAVIFGVLVIFSMNILLPSMLDSFQLTLLAATKQVDLTVRHRTGEVFAPAMLDEVRAAPGIRAAQGLLVRAINLPADFIDQNPAAPDQFGVFTLTGLDPTAAQPLRNDSYQSGRFLRADDGDAVVIASSLADNLGLKVGDTLSLPTAQGLVDLTIVGVYNAMPRPGNEELLVTLPVAQRLLNAPGQINAIEANFDSTDPARRTEIEQDIRQRLGPDYEFGGLSTETDVIGSLRIAQTMFNAFGFLALFMGAFIIFNTFRTLVAERRRDIGMLRAIGASRRTILGMILAEGLIQGVVGTAVGMVLGYLMAAAALVGASSMMEQYVHVQVGGPIVTPSLVALTIFLGVGVTLLAGLLPALSAGRITPLEALRPVVNGSAGESTQRRGLSGGALAGLALIALALLVLFAASEQWVTLGGLIFLAGLILVTPTFIQPFANVFGALLARLFARQGTGFLAQKNLSRQRTRVAITASTTIVALAIVVLAGEMAVSVEKTFTDILKQSLGSDYLFIPPAIAMWGNNVGADRSFTDQLRQIDGVGPISTLRAATTIADVEPTAMASKGGGNTTTGVAASMMGIDPQTFPEVAGLTFSEGDERTAYEAVSSERALIANGIFASTAGLKVGDVVPLITPTGRKEYRVVGVASDYMNAKIVTGYISQANMAADFNKTEDVFVQLNLAPGADPQVVEPKIKAVKQNFPQFTMVAGQAYYAETRQLFTVAFAAIYILFIFLAIPSLIAMLNTLAIGVIERTREIGMIRAIGAAKKQVSRMILAEALLLATAGTAFGLLAGLYLGYVLVGAFRTAGFAVDYYFPWTGLVVAIAIGLIFGGVAAILPARRAAQMDVIAALQYE